MTRIIADLQGTGVISESPFQEGDFMNNVFFREKSNSTEKDKKFRMILNVKDLNKHVLSQHFKMKTLDTCIQMMHENCFMASLDLKDAYFSIPIDEKSLSILNLISMAQHTHSDRYLRGLKIHPEFLLRL